MANRTCSIEGCDGKVVGRGWCKRHYYAWKRNGDPTIFKRSPTPLGLTFEQRFWMKVDKNGPVPEYAPQLGPCWMWTGTLTPRNYGYFGVSAGKNRSAHIVSYELLVGKVPDGLELDHLCHTLSRGSCERGDACHHRRCVNPAHLEPVTGAENSRRIIDAMPRCNKGHLFDEANTLWYRGHRRCRACSRDFARAKRQAPAPDTRHIRLTVKLSEADAALIDAASKGRPRSVWLREVTLAAAATGMSMRPGRPPNGSVQSQVAVLVLATEDEAALIDAARGATPRSTWMRTAALAAAA